MDDLINELAQWICDNFPDAGSQVERTTNRIQLHPKKGQCELDIERVSDHLISVIICDKALEWWIGSTADGVPSDLKDVVGGVMRGEIEMWRYRIRGLQVGHSAVVRNNDQVIIKETSGVPLIWRCISPTIERFAAY